MPIHDWTRVDAGTWHPFHVRWMVEIANALNRGRLPDGYYADPERPAPPVVPDVLALQEASHEIMEDVDPDALGGGTATAVASRPRLSVQVQAIVDPDDLGLRRTIAVRHESGDRLVALLELTSPANKDRPASVAAFTDKAVASLAAGVHVSVVDLFPARRHDGPGGLVGAVAVSAGLGDLTPPPEKPLMIGAFQAGRPRRLFAEPLAVGDALPDLPLFYDARGRYVDVPLAETYAAAWAATPRRWRTVIEASPD